MQAFNVGDVVRIPRHIRTYDQVGTIIQVVPSEVDPAFTLHELDFGGRRGWFYTTQLVREMEEAPAG